MSGYAEWYEANKDTLFWYKHRVLHGLDPDNTNNFAERSHWKEIKKARRKANEATNAIEAITSAPYFDKQYYLAKWWGKLQKDEKRELLLYTWGNKGDAIIKGYDWWLPYFKDVGFFTNAEVDRPEEPIKLYRASEPYFVRGMSWTKDYEMAKAFQDTNIRLLGDKHIHSTVVEPENILAIVEGNVVVIGEDNEYITKHAGLEYVVDHRSIKKALVEDEGTHE